MKKLINKNIGGKNISPVLPDSVKNYLIDIDGTIYQIPQFLISDSTNEEVDNNSIITMQLIN